MHIAQFHELSGKTNPNAIWDANFLILSRALHTGDSPENVQQALYDWLGNLPDYKRVTPEKLDSMLELGPEKAYAAVVQAIGGGFDAERLSPVAQKTLKAAMALIASQHIDRREQSISQEVEKLRGLRQAYRGESLARLLLR